MNFQIHRHGTRSLCALALLAAFMSPAFAGVTLTAPEPRVQAGGPVTLELLIVNEAEEPLETELPAPLHIRLETATGVSIVPFEPSRSGPVTVAPQSFVKLSLTGVLPEGAEGVASLAPTGLTSSPVLVEFVAPGREPQAQPAKVAERPAEERPPLATMQRSMLIDKPPPIAVSAYEPVYFLFGGDGGLNAKFQISLRYRLFDGHGKWAERWTWIDDIYLSYSQTSLWDLNELSKPFRDTSYRPRLFFSNYDLGRVLDGRVRLGFESGVGHESNGKEGDASRSMNMLYFRPMLTLGDPDGLRAYVAPLIHNYISVDENPDIHHYRGYVDWLMGIGSKGGLDFSATLRKGTRSDYGSIELNASYPLSKLSGGDLTGWLMLQYFNGHGESLLDYNRKLDSQLRLGIAIAL